MLLKLTVKHFNLILLAFFSLQLVSCFTQGFYIFGSLFYSLKNYFLAFRSGDIMYFSRTFTLLLRRRESIPTKSPPLCENSVKFPPRC